MEELVYAIATLIMGVTAGLLQVHEWSRKDAGENETSD